MSVSLDAGHYPTRTLPKIEDDTVYFPKNLWERHVAAEYTI